MCELRGCVEGIWYLAVRGRPERIRFGQEVANDAEIIKAHVREVGRVRAVAYGKNTVEIGLEVLIDLDMPLRCKLNTGSLEAAVLRIYTGG